MRLILSALMVFLTICVGGWLWLAGPESPPPTWNTVVQQFSELESMQQEVVASLNRLKNTQPQASVQSQPSEDEGD